MRTTAQKKQMQFNWDDPQPEGDEVSSVSTSDCSTGSRAASGDSASELEAAAFGGAERLPLDFPCGVNPATNGNDATSLENNMEPSTTNSANRIEPCFLLSDYKSFRQRLQDQSATIEDLHDCFERMRQSESGFINDLKSQLNAKQMQNLAHNVGQFAGKTKQENAESIYNALLRSFYLQGSVVYSPLQQTLKEKLLELVPAQSQDDLDEYYRSVTTKRQAEQKAVSNPETLSEFRECINRVGLKGLTDQQLESYDSLVAEQTRKSRAQAKPVTVTKIAAEALADSSFSIKEGFHEKRNCPLWIVQMTERVERQVYNELNSKAKMLGGWFSSFKKEDAGFQFLSESSALKFASLLKGDVDRSDELESRKEFREQTAGERLAEIAENLLNNANQMLTADQDKLKNTTRRASMAASMRSRAYADKALALTIHSIARSLEQGEATFLDGIRAKTHVETLLAVWRRAKNEHVRAKSKDAESSEAGQSWQEREAERERFPYESDIRFAKLPFPSIYKPHLQEALASVSGKSGCVQAARKMAKRISKTPDSEFVEFRNEVVIDELQDFLLRAKSVGIVTTWMEQATEEWKRLRAANIHTAEELRAALRELARHTAAESADDPVTKAEDNLRGRKLAGFFPTPRHIIDQMLGLVQLKGSDRILEPSCGKGDILDAVLELAPDANVTAIEFNRNLEEVLQAKGHEVAFGDFLEHHGEYDCIVMNPPFENGQDIDHVRHAFSLLAPGGRLVSIMSEGPFFRNDTKAIGFRKWLDEVGAETESLPDNAFRGSEAFRETGVRTRIVVARK
jgi:protein-L-isoaspartate O-methyltransferase